MTHQTQWFHRTSHPTKMKEKSVATSEKDLEGDPRFSFGPPKIQTAEDAVMAFLREEINEEEFRSACGKYGVIPGTLFKQARASAERVDDAFKNTIPDDIWGEEAQLEPLDERLKKADEDQKARDEATKNAPPVTTVVGGVPYAEIPENKKLQPAATVTADKPKS